MSNNFPLLRFSTAFAFALAFSSVLGRYRGGILRPDDDTETLKRVIHFYKYHGGAGLPESVEVDSNEVNLSVGQKPSYRIDIDMKDDETTDSPYTFSSEATGDEGENIARTTAPNPEEAEDETTTLFPVVKMEEFGITSVKTETLFTSTQPPASDVQQSVNISKPAAEVSSSTTTSPLPECSEGELKKRGCNNCICIDGHFFCSKRACPQVESGEDSGDFPSADSDAHKSDDKFDDAGDMAVSSTTADSTTTTVSTTPKPECHSGVSKLVDCNMCVCAPNGKWACTKRTCIALTLREKASYSNGSFTNRTEQLHENTQIDEDCNEGETSKLGCNICICFMNSWSCTKQECPQTTPVPKSQQMEEACQTEEDIKSMDCNVCHCRRGIWVCTKNDCKKFGHHNSNFLALRNKFRIRSGSKNRGFLSEEKTN